MPVIAIIFPNTEVIYQYQVIVVSPFSYAIYFLRLVNPAEKKCGLNVIQNESLERESFESKTPEEAAVLKVL